MQEQKSKMDEERSNCTLCHKKLGFLDASMGPCKCGGTFCKKHRDATIHDCKHDYRKEYQETLGKTMQVVSSKKVVMI